MSYKKIDYEKLDELWNNEKIQELWAKMVTSAQRYQMRKLITARSRNIITDEQLIREAEVLTENINRPYWADEDWTP